MNNINQKSKLSRKNRKQEIIRRRIRNLKYLWQVITYNLISLILLFTFIKLGWSPISAQQIKIRGSQSINGETIVETSGMIFPKPILSINPKEMEKNLLKELPIKSISIQRQLIPPGLEIQVLERKPITYAIRSRGEISEEGMLDEEGNWMPLKIAKRIKTDKIQLYVEGWMPTHKSSIAIILQDRKNLGITLRKIILSQNGDISLNSDEFSLIQLGSNPRSLKKQIKALPYLSRSLPSNFRNQKGIIVDIRDPEKPEIQIPKK